MAKNKKQSSATTTPKVAVKVAVKGPNANRRNGKAPKKNPKANPSTSSGKFGYSEKRLAALAEERDGNIDGVLLTLRLQQENKELARRRGGMGRPKLGGQSYKMDTIKQAPKELPESIREARKREKEERLRQAKAAANAAKMRVLQAFTEAEDKAAEDMSRLREAALKAGFVPQGEYEFTLAVSEGTPQGEYEFALAVNEGTNTTP